METSQIQSVSLSVSLFFVFFLGRGGSVYRHGRGYKEEQPVASMERPVSNEINCIFNTSSISSSRVTKLSAAKHENTQRGRPRRNSSVVLAANQPKAAENTVYGPLLNNLPNCLIRHNCKFELDSLSISISLSLSAQLRTVSQSVRQPVDWLWPISTGARNANIQLPIGKRVCTSCEFPRHSWVAVQDEWYEDNTLTMMCSKFVLFKAYFKTAFSCLYFYTRIILRWLST